MKYFFKGLFILASLIFTSLVILASILLTEEIKAANKIELKLASPIDNCKIYDKDMNEIANLGEAFFEYESIENISDNVINAFISVEDQEFLTHKGINTKRIFASLYENIANKKIVSGASTITQQYIKNAFLSNEKTFSRKIQEIILALKAEKLYTKEQILEAYLNNILFGGNIYGIKSASRYYFNKQPSDLTPSEGALLAGLVQSPNYYNPYNNIEAANERKNTVLELMFEEGYITLDTLAKEQEVNINDLLDSGYKSNANPNISSYLDYLFYYLNEENNNKVIVNNQKIYTYLDLDIQNELYKVIQNEYNHFQNDEIKCGLVVLDNNTGGILGLMGNRDTNRLVINYANTKVQVGSTIKPLLDYAPAIEYLNYTPATVILDEPYTYSDGTNVSNWDHQYKGAITLRKALSDSRNVPAVKMFQEVGINKVKQFGLNLGLDIGEEFYEADAIGGSTYGYTLVNLANSYLSFANLGYYVKASPIKKITNSYQTTKNDETKRLVMKPSTAFLINTILHDVFKNTKYDLNNTYLMAKTGQTNYDAKTKAKLGIPDYATKDSLVVAYTKDITLAIYVSYDKVSSTTYLDRTTKQIPREIMYHLMKQFTKNNQYYDIPENIVKKRIYLENGQIYAGNSYNSYDEYFLDGNEIYTIKDSNEKKI